MDRKQEFAAGDVSAAVNYLVFHCRKSSAVLRAIADQRAEQDWRALIGGLAGGGAPTRPRARRSSLRGGGDAWFERAMDILKIETQRLRSLRAMQVGLLELNLLRKTF